MGVLYYIPARRFEGGRVPESVKARRVAGDGAVCLEDLGLGHLDGAPLTYRGVRNQGPDGGAGLVIGLRVPADKTGIFKGKQHWMPCEGGEVFLGFAQGIENSELGIVNGAPGPETFLRAGALDASISIPLGDGNVWGFIETAALPSRAVYDSEGKRAWAQRAEDGLHYAASKWLFACARSTEAVPYFDIIDRVAVCLGARYHVSALEIFALGLFSMELSDAIVYACLGIDLEADSKKNGESAA